LGLVPSTSASFEQSCQLANQSELQLEPATTDQSEEPNTIEQSEVHLEPAGTEQLDLHIEPAITELQFPLLLHNHLHKWKYRYMMLYGKKVTPNI